MSMKLLKPLSISVEFTTKELVLGVFIAARTGHNILALIVFGLLYISMYNDVMKDAKKDQG